MGRLEEIDEKIKDLNEKWKMYDEMLEGVTDEYIEEELDIDRDTYKAILAQSFMSEENAEKVYNEYHRKIYAMGPFGNIVWNGTGKNKNDGQPNRVFWMPPYQLYNVQKETPDFHMIKSTRYERPELDHFMKLLRRNVKLTRQSTKMVKRAGEPEVLGLPDIKLHPRVEEALKEMVLEIANDMRIRKENKL